MKKICLVVFLLLLACKQSIDYEKRVKLRYETLKNYDANLFLNTYIVPRRVSIIDGKLVSAGITIYYYEKKDEITDRKYCFVRYYLSDKDNYEVTIYSYNNGNGYYSGEKNLSPEEKGKYRKFCEAYLDIYLQIYPAEISGWLYEGKFAIIKVTPYHELVYCPDTTGIPDVKPPSDAYSWINFFRTAEKLDSSWYIRYL